MRNIARYYHHETIQVNEKNDDTIENVRRGLMKSYGRTRFKQRLLYEPESLVSVSESPTKAVVDRGRNQSQSQSPRLSRKRSSSTAQMAPPASFKRSCSSFESSNPWSPIHNRVQYYGSMKLPRKRMKGVNSSPLRASKAY